MVDSIAETASSVVPLISVAPSGDTDAIALKDFPTSVADALADITAIETIFQVVLRTVVAFRVGVRTIADSTGAVSFADGFSDFSFLDFTSGS